jgi:DNA-binding NarL/FixJ family response regulator
VRVVIADDSVLMREGLARVLADNGFDVVAQVGDASALERAVRSEHPDVAIVDVRMPPTHTDEGTRAAVALRAEHPAVGVLVLSQVVEAKHALDLFRDSPEGFGYLLKDRVVELDEFLGPCDGSRTAAPSSIRTSSHSCSVDATTTTRSRS